MTRAELEQGVYRRLNKNTSSVDTVTQTRIRGFLNQRQRRLLGMPEFAKVRQGVVPFDSVASQSRYVLVNVSDVKSPMRETTNDTPIWPMSLAEYRTIAPDPSNSTSTPTHYVFQGWEPVAKQPSDASELFLDSTSASDTQTAYVEGVITGGYPRTASVSLTGMTAVSVSTSITSWIRIDKLYLASVAVGIVTLHEDADGGTELARIGIGKTQQRYWVFNLHPQPSAVINYSADVTRAMTDLAQDTDEPLIEEDFHYLLELGASMDELVKTDDPRYTVWKREYDEGIAAWQYALAVQALGTSRPREWSSLGAWYPNGT